MTKLNYDIDFFSVVPDQIFADPALAKMMGDIGITPNAAANVTVLFRDPATVEALRKAPESVRNWLSGAGVGLNVFSSDAPPGHYPARYEPHHLRLMQRLTDTLKDFDLPKAGTDTGDFKVSEFVKTVMLAKPWTPGAVPPQPTPSQVGASATTPPPFPASAGAGPGLPFNLAREMREEKERAQRKAMKTAAIAIGLGGLIWLIFLR